MRKLGAAEQFGTAAKARSSRGSLGHARKGAAVALVTAAIITGAGGFATADDPPAPAPAAATTTFLLTTMPNGWQNRTDLRPALEVLSDGRAVKRTVGADGVVQEQNGTVAADASAKAASDIRALAVADLGSPSVTDQGNMIIDYMPAPPDQDVHLIVYAPEFTDGLTDEQKASRKSFNELYQRLLNAFVPAV